MNASKIQQRLAPDRPTTTVSLQLPQDVVDDLKRIADCRGMASFEALIRAYISQGMRIDLEQYESSTNLGELLNNLRRHGVENKIIELAMAESNAAS